MAAEILGFISWPSCILGDSSNNIGHIKSKYLLDDLDWMTNSNGKTYQTCRIVLQSKYVSLINFYIVYTFILISFQININLKSKQVNIWRVQLAGTFIRKCNAVGRKIETCTKTTSYVVRGVYCVQWVKVRDDCSFCWYW